MFSKLFNRTSRKPQTRRPQSSSTRQPRDYSGRIRIGENVRPLWRDEQEPVAVAPDVHPEDLLNVKARRDAQVIPRQDMDDIMPTAVIPAVPPHGDVVVSRIGHAYNDIDAKCKAATALLLGDVPTVLAGLTRYAALHPAAM